MRYTPSAPALLALTLSSFLGALFAEPARADLPGLEIEATLPQRETFPVLAMQLSLKGSNPKVGMFRWQLKNSTSAPIKVQLKSLIQNGYTDLVVDNLTVPAGGTTVLYQNPSLGKRIYQVNELTTATAWFAADTGGKRFYESTQQISIRSKNDVIWGPKPGDMRWAGYVVAWVTPHDSLVQQLLGRAAQIAKGLPSAQGRKGVVLANYSQQGATRAEVRTNVRSIASAIYEATRIYGLNYVSSTISFGESKIFHQRVRFPRESLIQRSANCIDGAVLYASMFENLGLEAVIALVPGHALVGVRAFPGGSVVYIETTLTSRAPFDQAVKQGTSVVDAAKAAGKLMIIDIKSTRPKIQPFPTI